MNQDEIIRFLHIIQSIRIIEWNDIIIQENLGEESYGIVSKVTVPKSFAMKIIKYRTNKESNIQYERIHREIQLLHSCSHPNIN